MKVDEIIRTFGKSGTEFSSAVLKARRDRDVSTVCYPQVFKGSMFMERETQMKLLDGLLFNAKNAKEKRLLIVAVASSGMGKSAFVDEYCRMRLLRMAEHDTDDGLRNNIHPIAITFNTLVFGGSLGHDAVDLAARLLMSYFLSNPSMELLRNIYNALIHKNYGNFKNMDGVFETVVQCIKEDLRTQSGVSKPKILIACDEVGKSNDETKVVALLMSLIDADDDVECFFTGLSLNPFLKETSSGRFIEYVPLPLLTFQSSLQLVQSFMGGSASLLKVSSKLARLSGGHPRTIEVFETVIKENNLSNKQLNATELQAVIDSSFIKLPSVLEEEDIMLLLRPRTLLKDIIHNVDLIRAMGDGRIYATIFSPKDKQFVELFTSPMLLRRSLLRFEKRENPHSLIKNLNEMLKLAGLRDLDEFRETNAQQNGKTFQNFFFQMEILRRGFKYSELDMKQVDSLEDNFYTADNFWQNCDDVAFKLASRYDVVDVSCQSDFPSTNPADAAVLKRVNAMIKSNSGNKVVRPKKENQAAYNFFFILKDLTTGTRYVQLIEPTFSAGGSNPDQFFIDRYVKKLKAAESLAWNEVGIDVKDIIHTFVSTGSTSHIDWKTVFDNAGYSDRRVLILDKKDLITFYGPMLNVLFSSCFSD